MISIDLDIDVKGFTQKEIGYWTLARAYGNEFQFKVTNDSKKTIRGLNVRPVLESYVGQEKAQLYQWSDTKVIETISPNKMVPIKCKIVPHYPGLVSVTLYVTDADNKAVMAKRKTDSSYEEAPVRWWFHVADDISLEILDTLKQLLARVEETKK